MPLAVAIDVLELIESTLIMEDGYDFEWTAARAALEYLSHSGPNELERWERLVPCS